MLTVEGFFPFLFILQYYFFRLSFLFLSKISGD